MASSSEFRDWSLRSQLALAFASLSLVTTILCTATLATMAHQREARSLTGRATRIMQRLQQQLAPVVITEDKDAVLALFLPYANDKELDAVAVYRPDGTVIAGHGAYPPRLDRRSAATVRAPDHIVAIDTVAERSAAEYPIFLSFSTHLIDEQQRKDAWLSAAIGMAVSLFALPFAFVMARRLTGRVARLAAAARRISSGDLASPALDESARDEVGALAAAFNTMVADLTRLSDERDRSILTERERLEALVGERTAALEQSREMFRLMAESTQAIPFTLDFDQGSFTYIGSQGVTATKIGQNEWEQCGALDMYVPRDLNPELRRCLDECQPGVFEFVATWVLGEKSPREIRWTGTCELIQGRKILRGLMLDITEFRRLGRELAAAQKLESVGRLAAGVAHEINTPVQFVTDNVNFVQGALGDLAESRAATRALQLAVQQGGNVPSAAKTAQEADERLDIEYLMKEMPLAIAASLEGLRRIATIVRSMKVFAHPDTAQKTLANLNQAIESTVVIAANEFKYVADVHTELAELPPIPCYLGEINQVVLNLIVNASHAIADVVKETGVRGTITIRTRMRGDQVEIAVQDTGTGIPVAVRDKIFDPFFTTKGVGSGTGQGLAIARSMIAKKHSGTLHFETELGKGTTFFVRIPFQTPGTLDTAAECDVTAAQHG